MPAKKRVVSNKRIEPVVVVAPIPEEPAEEILETTPIPVEKFSPPKISVRANEAYCNYAIGDGINWQQGSVHEVDLLTFQRIMRDNPNAFEQIQE